MTPTIPLMNQWYGELTRAFPACGLALAENPPDAKSPPGIGLIGGGYYDFQPLTVTTYDSAYIHLERWGNRYGLIVFDECHHLPSPSYQFAAIGSIAPYRLGLTATPERADGRESLYPELIGPIVYRREIKQLAGDFLAEYRVVRIDVDLTPEEMERYDQARAHLSAIRQRPRHLDGLAGAAGSASSRRRVGIPMAGPPFRRIASRSGCPSPPPRRSNCSTNCCIATPSTGPSFSPTTTPASIRSPAASWCRRSRIRPRRANAKQILERFHSGEYNVVVTSQVLNEGVDVPAANVGIILSGTGSVREHVQRLGRLLRKHGDKQALLYEVVTRDTAEEFTSERRRQHGAYQ